MTTGLRFSYGDAMHKPHFLLSTTVPLLFLFLLGSCTDKVKTVHLLTDRAELASAVEMYNAANEDVLITIHQVESIDDELIKSEKPDLIIGSYLSSSRITDLLRPEETDFPVYEVLTGPRDSKGRSFLTPLSFEMPLIMGLKKTMSSLPDTMLVQPEDLREAALPYTATNPDGRLIRLGFSPTWAPRSLIDLLAVRYPEFFSGGMDMLDESLLGSVVEEVRKWITESAGDIDSDTDFNQHYRYIPDEYLIIDGRILFARTDFSYWASLPDTITNKLDIRYLSGPRKIPVTRVTRAGIPENSSSPDAAADFIRWLMLPETQSLLMERWERDGIDVFGFLGGLSSIPKVNESLLISRNPSLKSMIPEEYYLQVPSSFPPRWPRIRDEVVIPWFLSALSYPSAETGTSLGDFYNKWNLSSMKETK